MKQPQRSAAADSGNASQVSELNSYRDPVKEEYLRLIEAMHCDDDGMCPPPERPRREQSDEGPERRRFWAGIVTFEWSVRKGVLYAAVVLGVLASTALAIAK